MHPRTTKRIGVALCVALALGALWVNRGSDDSPSATPRATAPGTGPFTLRLSGGQALGKPEAPIPTVAGDPLDDHAIAAVTDRLSAFAGSDGDQVDFKRPPESLPRPRVGETIDLPFGLPGDAAPPAVPTGPLEVLRHQPDGDVATAPFVSVTFNQPMVPLGTLGQLDEAEVPVTVTPPLAGRWRWIGTSTLRFENDDPNLDRLPAATAYTVEIPAGTAAASGSTLDKAVTWTFTTPPPHVQSLVPEGDVIDTAPIFVATFDQRVDPEAVLASITLSTDRTRLLRLATAAEVDADDVAREQTDAALDGHWVAFTPRAALPNDAAVTIEIGPDTPSAEGPLRSTEPSTQRTRTYAPLEVSGHECGFGGTCRPGNELAITLNNPLDLDSFDADLIKVSPAVGASIGVYGNRLSVQASTSANTAYEVTLPSSLRDSFGQTLGHAETVRFEVGDAVPALQPFPKRLITTDPFAPTPRVSVTSIGHDTLDVTLYAVTADDYAAFADFLDRWDGETLRGLPSWPRISDATLTVGDPTQLTESGIDLRPALGGTAGHVVVVVTAPGSFARDSEAYWQNRPTVAWVQATSIGVDALADPHRLVAWATDLQDGAPLEGVTVRLGGAGTAVVTDVDGLASLPIEGHSRYLLAERNGETALLAPDYSSWDPFPVGDSARWYVIDDRQLYRPGETAHLKGWVRRLTLSGDAHIEAVGGSPSIRYVVNDSFGNELATGTGALTRSGGFDFAVDLPPGASLGPAYVQIDLVGGDAIGETSYQHAFQIEEFRRPEFEVVTRAESTEPHLLTAPVTVAAVASYFAGGTLSDAPVTWQVTNQPTTYSPPNWADFTFGVERPFWLEDRFSTGFAGEDRFFSVVGPFNADTCCENPETENLTYQGRTDSSGTHYLQLDFQGQKPDEPVTVSANAAVTDVNRQGFASSIDLLVHPASLYVGLTSDRPFVRQGDPLVIKAIVTDIDGHAVAGRRLTITAARVTQKLDHGEWTDVDVDPQDCTVTSADAPETCSFTTEAGGQYKITSVVSDDDGGRNRTELTRFVSGADAVPTRSVEQETVTLVPGREHYVAGDTAELLVLAPFENAHGLLTVSRNGIEQTRTFQVAGGSTVLEIPITDALVPGFDAQVDLVGSTPRARDDGTTDPALPPRPAYASGSIHLAVPPTTKTLDVTATPADPSVEPGGDTSVEVTVLGANGAPVSGAEVAVVVVDEAVLSLVGYDLPNPIDAIYQPLLNFVRTDHARQSLLLADPVTLGGTTSPDASTTTFSASFESTGAAIGGGAADRAQSYANRRFASKLAAIGSTTGSSTIDERTNFDALAVFEPALPTGADGTVSVDVTLPDSLTRYRVMAVAADAVDRFGSAESTITARLPLQVRPSPPRFLNFGDRFELPVVVQNQTDEDLTVDVVVEAANLALSGPAGQRVSVPANERVEVRFPASAQSAGTVRYRVSAVSGDLADSASGSLPAYTPTTTEAFATYGVLDDGAVAQPLLTPTGVVPQFGGLEIDTSSTAVQALTDAVIYLADYPYESADAYASRIIALVSLKDVFAAFETSTAPTPAELDATIRADVAALTALQNDDGGFSTWQRGAAPQPYDTVQATHALVTANAAGYPVSGDALGRAMAYLADIEAHLPTDWDEASRHAVSAYALHVRALGGSRDPGKAEALYRSDDALALDALAWIWPVIDDPGIDAAIEQTFMNRVTETAGAAAFATGFDESAAALVLASDRRTDGIVLDALLTKRPGSDLVPKVVTGLVGNQVKGRWGNVQENGFILLALHRYFATFEAQAPAFVARTWLGTDYVAEHPHQGRSIDVTHTLVPMTELGGNPDVVVAKDGPGRLYYRLGLRYAPADLTLDPRDEGFVVDRTYEAVDDPDDVRRDGNGTWHIKPGAMVRVRLTLVADSQRTNMVLVDALPAGLEIVNPALAASPRPTPQDPPDGGGGPIALTRFPYSWFDHQSFRDDRAEAYSAYLPAGTYEYSYIARATTPGIFVTPPTKAEEIYAPEVFGRTATDTVAVG